MILNRIIKRTKIFSPPARYFADGRDFSIKESELKKEKFDSPEELEIKIDQLAKRIMNSRHFIAFTGAGISTSAGIPDYRSGHNTVLETGPGKWEEKNTENITFETWIEKPSKFKRVDTTKAFPTLSHHTLKTWLDSGILKFIISQNIDGLHRRSGV